MSVIEVKEIHQQRRGQIDKFLNRTYYRAYRVLCDTTSDDAAIIYAQGQAKGLPVMWQQHPNDSSAYVTEMAPQAEGEDGKEHIVLVTYTTAVQELNPLLMPPIGSWSTQEIPVPIDYDVFGDAILNTAEDAYDPAIEIPFPMPRLSVSRNELISPSVWNLMAGSINLDIFQGFPPNACRFLGCSGTENTYTDPNTNALVLKQV